ncbi:MAG: hypothetical protein RR954_07805 [Christensenellaceae bacterium]
MSKKKTKNFRMFQEHIAKPTVLDFSTTNIKGGLLGRNEKFVGVIGFSGYFISNYGRMISHKGSLYSILKPQLNGSGYNQYTLYGKGGKGEQFAAHRLVAQHFCKGFNADFNNEVHHKDHEKLNNYYKNLMWVDSVLHGFLSYNCELFFANRYANSEFVPITNLHEISLKMGMDLRAISHVLRGSPLHITSDFEIYEFDDGSGAQPYLIGIQRPAKTASVA